MSVKVSAIASSASSRVQVRPSWIERRASAVFTRLMERLRIGSLAVRFPDGTRRSFGDPDSGLRSEIRIHSYRFFRRLITSADIGIGESYVEGEWDADDLTRVLIIFCENMELIDERSLLTYKLFRWANRFRHALRRNTVNGSRKNISHHYDLGNEFYRLFLDETMMYSCGVYTERQGTLEQAQRNKLDKLIEKARIGPDDHVLEIGSGWGSFAIEAVRATGCRVTTTTISKEQFKVVQERVREADLEDRITPLLCDYRKLEGRFDKIVSIEMLEAVGHEYYGTFFRTIDRLLKPNGLAVIQVITIPDQRYADYRRSTDWIQKHVFPGAVVPSLEALSRAMTRDSQLMVESLENIGIHYARTLRDWRERFQQKLSEAESLGYDSRFQRMWNYYLCYCEAGFATRILNDLHLVLTRPNNKNLPGEIYQG